MHVTMPNRSFVRSKSLPTCWRANIIKISLAILGFVFLLASSAEAMVVSRVPERRDGKPTGWYMYRVSLSAAESRALHKVPGFNLRLGRQVVDRMMTDMGAPRGFTATAAMAPAIGWATARVGYDLWYWSIQHKGRPFLIAYRFHPSAAAQVRRVLGGRYDAACQRHQAHRERACHDDQVGPSLPLKCLSPKDIDQRGKGKP